jgi:hypothetical protein
MTLDTYLSITNALNAQSRKLFEDLARAKRLNCNSSIALWEKCIEDNFRAMDEVRDIQRNASKAKFGV